MFFVNLLLPSTGLWNVIFLFSNLSLVFLLPFAYFLTESEGFVGSKKVLCKCLGLQVVLVFPKVLCRAM